MRLFENLFLVLLLFSWISLLLFKKQKTSLNAGALAIYVGVVSILSEGYRIHIVPAFILAVGLLLTVLAKKYVPKIKMSRVIKGIGLIFLIPLAVLSIALPLLFPVVQLPAPIGSYPVGSTHMSLWTCQGKRFLRKPQITGMLLYRSGTLPPIPKEASCPLDQQQEAIGLFPNTAICGISSAISPS